jgi:hypothetical protein
MNIFTNMGGATALKFYSNDRPTEELKRVIIDDIDRVDQNQVSELDDGTLLVVVSSGNFGLPVSTPCERVLSFWQNDTSMTGGGRLYEWDAGQFVEVDEQWDDDYGRRSYEYFKNEYGIEPYPPKMSLD